MIRPCKICHKEFEPKSHNGVLCSDSCKSKNKKLIMSSFKSKNPNYFSDYQKDNIKLLEYRKNWYENNKEHKANTTKKWNLDNIDRVKKRSKEYYRANRERLIEQARIYSHNRRQIDPLYKLTKNLRKRLHYAIKNNQKAGSAIRDLGCSINKLKIHLQLKFHRNPTNGEYMTWSNYGQWEIDHKMSLASFDLTNPEQLKKACHYTNLQPLWAKDNRKKSNK